MELWVSGFNAWGQLNPCDNLLTPSETLPDDLNSFRNCMEDEEIHILWTSISATLLKTTRGVFIFGSPDEITDLIFDKLRISPLIAVAGNEKMAVFENGVLRLYDSLKNYFDGNGKDASMCQSIIQLEANQTSFTALSSTGDVWTWGDVRFSSCLGRDVSEKSSASIPGQVSDLCDLPTGPIKKISSGGNITAALTEDYDLYIWGGWPGHPGILKDLTNNPMPVDLEGANISDIAVGNDHILALTMEGRLFVVGSGSSGQLGVGSKQLNQWKEVKLSLKEGQRIFKIHAGYKTSLVTVK